MYRTVTWVTSGVGVPLTHLVWNDILKLETDSNTSHPLFAKNIKGAKSFMIRYCSPSLEIVIIVKLDLQCML